MTHKQNQQNKVSFKCQRAHLKKSSLTPSLHLAVSKIFLLKLDLLVEKLRFMSILLHHRSGGCHMAEEPFFQAPCESSDYKHLLLRCNCVGAESHNMLSVMCVNYQAIITCFANDSTQNVSLSVAPDRRPGPIIFENSFLPFLEPTHSPPTPPPLSQLPRSCTLFDLTQSQMSYLAVTVSPNHLSEVRCSQLVGVNHISCLSQVFSIKYDALNMMTKCHFLFVCFFNEIHYLT